MNKNSNHKEHLNSMYTLSIVLSVNMLISFIKLPCEMGTIIPLLSEQCLRGKKGGESESFGWIRASGNGEE